MTVHDATLNGTALAGSDLQASPGTLLVPAGSRSANVVVTITGDTKRVANETFSVHLGNPTAAVIKVPSATGSILNDD